MGCIVLVCGVCGVGALQFMTHTGIIIDGKEVSRMQVFEAKREILKMDRDMKASGYRHLDDNFQSKNPLTLRYRKYLLAILEQERLQREHNANFHVDLLNRLMLSDQASRDQARIKFAEHDEKVKSYFDSELEIEKQVQILCVQIDGRESTYVQRAKLKLETGKRDFLTVQKARANLLDFLDKTPHRNSATGQVLFESQNEIASFNSLRKDLNSKSTLYTNHLRATVSKSN